jgi:hypothetical protein
VPANVRAAERREPMRKALAIRVLALLAPVIVAFGGDVVWPK